MINKQTGENITEKVTSTGDYQNTDFVSVDNMREWLKEEIHRSGASSQMLEEFDKQTQIKVDKDNVGITLELQINALLFPNQKGEISISQEGRQHIVKEILGLVGMTAKELINMIQPKHGRTSCSDSDLNNGFNSSKSHTRCMRCTLLEIIKKGFLPENHYLSADFSIDDTKVKRG